MQQLRQLLRRQTCGYWPVSVYRPYYSYMPFTYASYMPITYASYYPVTYTSCYRRLQPGLRKLLCEPLQQLL